MDLLMTAIEALPDFREELDPFLSSRYAEYLKAHLASIQPRFFYPSGIHGRNHNERVLLYGCMIGRHEDFNDADMDILCDACVYHDIGRANDAVDDYHGQRSADRIHQVVQYEDIQSLRILRAVMEAHSKDDRIMSRIFDSRGVEDHPRALRIARALKDADALDRVRVDLLDPRYLRFDYSKTLIDLSWALCRLHMQLSGISY